jgi:electron transport complex protein RnfC
MGTQCFNVATAYCVWRAITFGEPLLSRIVTVTGNVEHPQNYEVLLGTPVDELVKQAGNKPDTNRHIMGGPMMGLCRSNTVGRSPGARSGWAVAPQAAGFASNAQPPPTTFRWSRRARIIAASGRLFPPPPPALPCIRCTRCAEVCPAELQPQELYWFAKAKDFGKTQEYSLFDCIECGACAYVCPSQIPLVQYYRFAKSEIWQRENEASGRSARERHEFREYRFEREKQEKAEKLAARTSCQAGGTAVRQPADASGANPAAIACAKNRRRSQPKTPTTTAQQQAEIAETSARAHIHELANRLTKLLTSQRAPS